MIIEKCFGIDRDIVQQMIAATEKMTHEKTGDNGFQATKVFLFDEYAALKMQNMNFRNVTTEDANLKHLERLAGTLLELQADGVNVIPIMAFRCENGNGYIVQQRAKGTELYDRHKTNEKSYVIERVKLLSNAPQEHFNKFVADAIRIIVAGVIVDFAGKDNFFYDEKVGFQFIDLNAHFDYVYGVGDKISDETIKQIVGHNCFLPCYFDTVSKHRDTVSQVFTEMTDDERSLLCERNRIIFGKCKFALINNGISTEMINGIIADERFIPQKHQVGLHTDSGVMNWWDNRSDEYYGGIQNGLDDIFDRADRGFPIVVWDMIRRAFPDLRGKRVLVPSSGDNIAVFGFHLLGASVTSCDISERQLYNAKKVADRFDWNIEFIRQDSMELTYIPDNTYDLVYTSNGVHVWIPNLPKMYGNFNRVLKPDGKYIMFETHPFCRPFDTSGTEIKVKKPYTETGPFVSEVKTGTITEFGWRIMDLFNAVFDNGFCITHMEEFSPGKDEYDNYFYSHHKEAKEDDYKRHDWKYNPWAALPQCIGFTARKSGE